MTSQLTSAQLHAFLALVISVVLVSMAPMLVSAGVGKAVPDNLVAVSDKTVTGLIGVLATLVGVMWQSRPKASEPAGTPNDPVSVSDVGPDKEAAS